jgi:hypothetical protein
MDFREVVWGGMDLIHLVQDRGQSWAPVITVMKLQVQQVFVNSRVGEWLVALSKISMGK